MMFMRKFTSVTTKRRSGLQGQSELKFRSLLTGVESTVMCISGHHDSLARV